MAAEKAPLVDVVDLVSAFVVVAERTGGVIRDVLEAGRAAMGVVEKAEGAASPSALVGAEAVAGVEDPQTVADRRGQAVIVDSLLLRWPGMQLVGEEGKVKPDEAVRHLVSAPPDERHPDVDRAVRERLPRAEDREYPLDELVVWIDPLDGTKGFTRGHKEGVTVLVGVSHKGHALAGVVHRPFSGETAWGVAGACSGGVRVKPAGERDAARRRVVSSTYHATEDMRAYLASVRPTETCSASGAGNKGLLVLSGEVDAWAYPSQGTKRWDTCAVEAVVRGFGGKLTDAFGDRIVYEMTDDPARLNNSRGVLCTANGVNHASYALDRKHEAALDKAASSL